MQVSRRLCIAGLAVAVWAGTMPAYATQASQLPGRLLIEDGRSEAFVSHARDLKTGRSQALPRSPAGEAQTSPDIWQAGQPGGNGTLVRKDPIGNLAFINGHSLQEDGSISVGPLRDAGLDPQFQSAIPSPDGQMLLGYWRPYGEGKPRLFVISRPMTLRDDGSPLRYPTDEAAYAIDWLPDGRYVYLAGNILVVARPGQGCCRKHRWLCRTASMPRGRQSR